MAAFTRRFALVFLLLVPLFIISCSQEPELTGVASTPTTVSKAIPAGYYDTVDDSTPANLRTTLHDVIDDHTRIPYTSTATDTWNVLELADEDPNDSGRILDLYLNESYPKYGEGNTDYNREHTWPSSYGFPSDVTSNYPYTDCHHLFLCNDSYNSTRGNKPYGTAGATGTERPTVANDGVGGGSGVYPGWSNWYETTYWETWMDRRGDVARALLYLDVRYEGGTHGVTGHSEPDLILTDNLSLIQVSGSNASVAYMGMLSVLLTWHVEDPVDANEIARNDAVFAHQGNRNPFIDHPEWVDCLFNGNCGGGGDTTPPAAPTGLGATAGSGTVDLDWNDNGESDLSGYRVYRATASGGPYNQVGGTVSVSQYQDTGLTGGTTYYYVVTAVDTSNNESPQSGEANATPTGGSGGPTVWINEFHYDNDSTDTGEFFEIAGTAGTNLSGWQVIGYNGSGGAVYDTENLTGIIPDQLNGYGTLSFAMTGMQNGSPDGLALYDGSDVVMFISYEGSFTATDGVASGLTSTDIGVSEPTDSPVGWSLQLAGDGTDYAAFTWQAPAAETPGAINTGQTFGTPANVDPTAEANGPYAAETGNAIAFSSAGSADSDGTIVSYDWDFGDGGSSTEANPSYTYAAAGNYTVTLTVTDDDGATGQDTAGATVTDPNQAPTAEAGGPYAAETGGAIAFSSAGSTDADGTIVSYDWDFGDGGSSTDANPSYTYASAGNYTVTLTVTDDDGATGQDTAPATVTDPQGGGDPVVWINEFHYDNDGADKNEFVEVAGTAGTDLTGWTVAGYNGADGTVYMTVSFSGLLTDQQAGFGTQAVAMVGMQNGSPDGLALVDGTGTVVQFLSYEGSFTAVSGPAAGMTSTDIGISEPSTAPRRTSLQLAGSGSAYADFYWEGPLGKTDGSVNENQVFSGGGGGDTTPPAAPSGLGATAGDGSVSLEWADNGESDLDGYTVYRATGSGGPYTALNGSLLSGSSYTDTAVSNGTTYYYVVTASDLTGNESGDSAEVSATPQASGGTTAMHVDAITLTSTVVRNKEYGHAAVLVVDDLGNPVAGVTVSGTFTGSIPGSASAVTGADGVADLTSPKTAKPGISFTFCVDNLVLSGYTYDSGANVETCDSH